MQEEERLSLREAADALGVSEVTARRWVKAGKLKAHQPGRKYLIPSSAVDDLLKRDLGKARAQSPEPLVRNVKDEQRAAQEAAVENAQLLRQRGRGQLTGLIDAWKASKERGELRSSRRGYLDEMEDLLQEAYRAYTAVEDALREAIEAAFRPGGRKASVPSYLQKETRAATDFYIELFGLVSSVGLSVSAGDDATAAKRAAKAQPEARSHHVEEPYAA